MPIKDKQKSKKVKQSKSNTKPAPDEKVKSIKSNTKSVPEEKKKPINKPAETQTLTPPSIKEVPIKKSASSPPPPPPPPVQPPTNTKSKREKAPPVIQEPTETLNVNEPDDIDNDDRNNSVVGRAYYFVKNMFQLSDDILENNHTHEEDQIISSANEQQQQHRQSRKLLSIDDDTNDYELEDISNDLSLSFTNIFKRQLLSVKTNKRSISSKTTNIKDKKTNSDANKPKVGWTYRYRISRYLADKKMKRNGHANKAIGGGKYKQQQNNKKISSSIYTKFSKRKLLELDFDDESSLNNDEM